ncbi:molecular chaperone HscB [Azospirillum lipoferum]|uniref:Molecular chaperone DnaJ n=1 Tax=Azospirillum lipoferum TaxID=193 RepID=A0A5A9GVI2_AZOLI|nr:MULTISPECIES: molecular chaperone DnaJ [Azospirillum]KAA0598380.1 molecular chaperone DnaJ [Azospirillum lipoferum]MCP1609629.1 molecular chaperone HscB [Azospirillum lipoferum]MDW5535064.1 molecular chaperone DnaJ [Azospirillum sp. NL1]
MTRSKSGPPGNSGGISGAIAGDLEPCGTCGRSVAPRALFCHACGAAQPPRPLDPFTRLGLERRFDIDLEQLSKQHAGFTRVMDPERFAARGPRQQANAKAQVEALREAYEVLRDPIRRAHALLALLGGAPAAGDEDGDEEIDDLATRLTRADDVLELDRIGLDLNQRVEACIRYLAPAFRKAQTAAGPDSPSAFDGAARILARLERLEALAAEVRDRRAARTTPRT